MANIAGKVFRVVGPVVEIEEVSSLRMLDMVAVGEQHLIGEVVHLKGEYAYVQVYEDTTSIKAGDLVYSEGYPLYVELAPGLLGNIYDGIQRPLEVIRDKQGVYISRGVGVAPLDLGKKWHFKPVLSAGDTVGAGAILGEVQETALTVHKILVPPDVSGKIKRINPEGDYTVVDTICVIETGGKEIEINMRQKWPVRKPRPYKEKLNLGEPLITGQRVIDTLFPIAK
ncbi:MAG: V-type ATP synthase subunit A, partial [Candidatus Omnitrophica bacterium]|nr:V-type ATP synthase subunit A [Candidatus Omnitrophota bacterium]